MLLASVINLTSARIDYPRSCYNHVLQVGVEEAHGQREDSEFGAARVAQHQEGAVPARHQVLRGGRPQAPTR